MRQRVNPADFPELSQVITLAEACRIYKVHRKNITLAIDGDRIAAVRCGRSVLISRRSLENYLYPLRR